MERIAQRLADAASAMYIGEPSPEEAARSPMLNFAEDRLIVWYMERRLSRIVFITRVQYWPPAG